MKFVIQRVNHAEVKVDGETVGKIGKGFLVLIGVGREDTKEDADWYLKKLLGLRIFEDENGKTNLSLADVNGELLLVSQFTLYANAERETVQVLLKPEHRMKQIVYMNILFLKRKKRCRL